MENQSSGNPLLKTPLYDRHLALGAKMVDFGGWNLPVHYAGILEEHRAVREQAGLFDVSHMGEITVSGPRARAFLDHLLTASLDRLTPQRAVYSPMCYENGGTVDDLIVYEQSGDDYLLVVNAANTGKDFDWIWDQAAAFSPPGAVDVYNRSAEFAQLALQGPAAAAMIGVIPGLEPAADLRFFNFLWLEYEPGIAMMIARTGYTGEDGFEIYCPPDSAGALFDRLVAAGAVPCGLGARDSLRFEAALPLYGHELEADITPREAGLDRFIDLGKGPFIGRDALAAAPARRLIGLRLDSRAIPRAGYPVLYQGAPVGKVTSGMYAPTLGHGFAMALVEAACASTTASSTASVPTGTPSTASTSTGTTSTAVVAGPAPAAGTGFAILIRGREEAAIRTPLPFYHRSR